MAKVLHRAVSEDRQDIHQPQAKASPPSLEEKTEPRSFPAEGGEPGSEKPQSHAALLCGTERNVSLSPCLASLQEPTCFTECLLCIKDGARPCS